MNALAFNVLAGLLSSVAFLLLMKMVAMKWCLLRKFVNWTGESQALRAENSISRIKPLDILQREGTMPSSDPNLLRDLEQANGLVGRMDSDVSTSVPGNRSKVHEHRDSADIAGIAGLVDERVGFNEA